METIVDSDKIMWLNEKNIEKGLQENIPKNIENIVMKWLMNQRNNQTEYF